MSSVDNDGSELINDTVNKQLVEYLYEHMQSYKDAGYYFPVEKCLLPANFREIRQRIRGLEVYDDDTWVVIYPKSGSTWAIEMVWQITNDLDYKRAEADILVRFPYIEFRIFTEEVQQAFGEVNSVMDEDPIEYINKMPRPRFIRSHMPLDLLPTQVLQRKPKIVTVLRDPKDVAVSFYHFLRMFEGYTGAAGKCFEAFRQGLLVYGDYWHHVAPFWKLRNESNVLVLTYEEMKKDLAGVINRTAEFFGKKYTADQVSELVDHLSVDKMRKNKSVNMQSAMDQIVNAYKQDDQAAPPEEMKFIRKGIVGDHKNIMSEDVIKEFDSWTADMKIKFGLSDDKDFPY